MHAFDINQLSFFSTICPCGVIYLYTAQELFNSNQIQCGRCFSVVNLKDAQMTTLTVSTILEVERLENHEISDT